MSGPLGLFGAIHEAAAIAKTLKVSSEEASDLQRALAAERLAEIEWAAAANNVIPFRPSLPVDRVR